MSQRKPLELGMAIVSGCNSGFVILRASHTPFLKNQRGREVESRAFCLFFFPPTNTHWSKVHDLSTPTESPFLVCLK